MDLQLSGRKAIVCAGSRGLGYACALSLAKEGVDIVLNARGSAQLETAAADLRQATGVSVAVVAADINTPEGRTRLLNACATPDILINNNAGPPPGKLADWTHDVWLKAIEANMLAPIFMIQAVLPGMRERRFGRIINITSAMVKSPRPAMGLSTAARTGLTAFAKSMSLDCAVDNVTINNLLPERIDTGRQRFMAERMMSEHAISYEEARQRIADSIAAKRFGRPEEFADACAFLCSHQAGFISGQNLQIDGGSYHGLV